MEKITIFLALFIAIFLIYSYFSYKKDFSKKEIKKNKDPNDIKESYEKHIVVAAIASIMDGKKYKIRNVFLEKQKNKKEQKSMWKIAGRDYNMQRRERI